MESDSSLALSALLLCGVCALAWRLAGGSRAQRRLNLRFAAVLFCAAAAAGLLAALIPSFLPAAFAIALLVTALASPALALSLAARARPLVASAALIGGLGAGLAAVLRDAPLFALLSLVGAVLAVMLLAFAQAGAAKLRLAQTIAAGLALAGGGMALWGGAFSGALILFAAGLLGLSLSSEVFVQQQADPALHRAIGGARLG